MFRAADLLLVNKIDLLPHLRFDIERCIAYARIVHPGIEVLKVSAETGEGMAAWYAWLARHHASVALESRPSLEAAETVT
jgi:hydrogenase nickel incorporation protein HypB